ncbi:MAG: PD-(D/E)XK nuclease domain-containing protein, partial [Desulfovibrio sp.]|nr:PD-(D/E)XK nuclease domain-containing protein [Desulfovibrio sp.]
KIYESSGSKGKEDLFRGHIKSFLQGANFIVQGEARTNVGIADIVAVYKGKTLVIEVKYVDLEPKSEHNDVVSRFTMETDCRDKLTQAISQIHGKNYDELFPNSLPIAIVIDESRAARISHAAYKKEAYRIDGKAPDFIKIGDVKYDGDEWSISYSSEITASKKPLPIAKSRASTISRKTANVKKTPPKKSGVSEDKSADVQSSAVHGNDRGSVNMELFLCKAILPANQYLSWSDSISETDGDEIRNKIHRLATNLVETKSAEFWHSLSHEEKNKALQEAVGSDASITLRYFTRDGNFCLTAIETTTDEAIGLLITQLGEAAYGPYPLSRLRENVSSLIMYDTATKLGQICKDNGIKVDAPLPTPEQLLKWSEKK